MVQAESNHVCHGPSHVLPLKDIPKLMCELTRHPHFDDQESVAIESAKVARELKKKLK